MKFLKPIISTTGYKFSVKSFDGVNITLTLEDTECEYVVFTQLDNSVMEKREDYYAFVPCLGDIRNEDLEEFKKLIE